MKTKKRGCKELLKLLGADAGDPIPSSIEEAKMIHEEQEEESYITYHTPTRLDNSCMKVCYGSQREANGAAKRRLNVGSNTSRLSTYFCDECKAWHMSSSFH